MGWPRPGEESRLRRRCSMGSSGEAIPCQPEPLKRRHWARVTLGQEAVAFPGLARPRSEQGDVHHRVTVDALQHPGSCDCNAPSTVHSRRRNWPDTCTISERSDVPGWLDPAAAPTSSNPARPMQTSPDPIACPVTTCLTLPAPSGTCRRGLDGSGNKKGASPHQCLGVPYRQSQLIGRAPICQKSGWQLDGHVRAIRGVQGLNGSYSRTMLSGSPSNSEVGTTA